MSEGIGRAQDTLTLLGTDEINFTAVPENLLFHIADLSGIAQARRPCRQLLGKHYHLVAGVDVRGKAFGHIQQPVQKHVAKLYVIGVWGGQDDIAKPQIITQPLNGLAGVRQSQLVQGISGDIGTTAVGNEIDALGCSLLGQEQQQVAQGSRTHTAIDPIFIG